MALWILDVFFTHWGTNVSKHYKQQIEYFETVIHKFSVFVVQVKISN